MIKVWLCSYFPSQCLCYSKQCKNVSLANKTASIKPDFLVSLLANHGNQIDWELFCVHVSIKKKIIAIYSKNYNC